MPDCHLCHTQMAAHNMRGVDIGDGAMGWECRDREACAARYEGVLAADQVALGQSVIGYARELIESVIAQLQQDVVLIDFERSISRLRAVDRILRYTNAAHQLSDAPATEDDPAYDSARVRALVTRVGHLEARVAMLEELTRVATAKEGSHG
jgi:hypothetical protein